LDWEDAGAHSRLLETKIVAYLDYIESGQINAIYPDSAQNTIVISVEMQHSPEELGLAFFKENNHVFR
jgi:hypothetical protein